MYLWQHRRSLSKLRDRFSLLQKSGLWKQPLLDTLLSWKPHDDDQVTGKHLFNKPYTRDWGKDIGASLKDSLNKSEVTLDKEDAALWVGVIAEVLLGVKEILFASSDNLEDSSSSHGEKTIEFAENIDQSNLENIVNRLRYAGYLLGSEVTLKLFTLTSLRNVFIPCISKLILLHFLFRLLNTLPGKSTAPTTKEFIPSMSKNNEINAYTSSDHDPPQHPFSAVPRDITSTSLSPHDLPAEPQSTIVASYIDEASCFSDNDEPTECIDLAEREAIEAIEINTGMNISYLSSRTR